MLPLKETYFGGKAFCNDTGGSGKNVKNSRGERRSDHECVSDALNPAVVEAKGIIDRGEIGKILSITGINHGKIPSGWFIDPDQSGGGGIMDHTVHLADLMRWFTGSEYEAAYCEGGDLIHDKNIDDCGSCCCGICGRIFRDD